MPKRVLQGVVVSDCNNQTITLLVERKIKHPLYKKTIMKSKKYTAHDPLNQFKKGDAVRVIESKPISKTKKWHVIYNDEQSK